MPVSDHPPVGPEAGLVAGGLVPEGLESSFVPTEEEFAQAVRDLTQWRLSQALRVRRVDRRDEK
jgi:hypothetical protein